jgi:hypothetical protein
MSSVPSSPTSESTLQTLSTTTNKGSLVETNRLNVIY